MANVVYRKGQPFPGAGGFDPSTMPTLNDISNIIGTNSSGTAGKMAAKDVLNNSLISYMDDQGIEQYDDTQYVLTYYSGFQYEDDPDYDIPPEMEYFKITELICRGIDDSEEPATKPSTWEKGWVPMVKYTSRGNELYKVPYDEFGGGGIDPESLNPNDDAITLLDIHLKSGTTDTFEIGYLNSPEASTPISYPLCGLGYGYEDVESAISGDAPKVGWLNMMNQLDYAAGLYGLYLDTSDPTNPDVQFGMLPFDSVVISTIEEFENAVEEADFSGSNPDKIDTLLFKDQYGDWKKTDRSSFITHIINTKPFGPDNAKWNGMLMAPWFDKDTETFCDIAPVTPYEVPEKYQDEIFNYKLGYHDDPDNPGEKSLVYTKDDGSSKSVNMFINDSIHLKTPYDFENLFPTSNPSANLIQIDYYNNYEMSIWPAAGGDYLYWEIPSTGLAGKYLEFGMSEWWTQAPNASTTTIWYVTQNDSSGGSLTTNIVYGLKLPSQVDGVSRNCGTFRVNDSGNPIRIGIKFTNAGWYNSIYSGLYLVDLSEAAQAPVPQERTNLFPTNAYDVTWTWEDAGIIEGPIPESGYYSDLPMFGGQSPQNWSGYRKDIKDSTLINSLKGHTLEMGVLHYYHIVNQNTGEEVTNYNPYRMILGANSDTPNVIRPNTKTKSKVFNKELPCIRYTVPNDATQISVGWMVDAQQDSQTPVTIIAAGLYLYDLDAGGLIRGRDFTGSLMKFGYADGDRLDTIIDKNMLVVANQKEVPDHLMTYPELMAIDDNGNKIYPYYSEIVRHVNILHDITFDEENPIKQQAIDLSSVGNPGDIYVENITAKVYLDAAECMTKGIPKVILSCTMLDIDFESVKETLDPDAYETAITTAYASVGLMYVEDDSWDFFNNPVPVEFDIAYRVRVPSTVVDPLASSAVG